MYCGVRAQCCSRFKSTVQGSLMGDLSSTPTSEFAKVDTETFCASLSTTVFLSV